MKIKVHGYYFATMNFPNLFFENAKHISTLFGNLSQYKMDSNLARNYMVLEAILTDPNETLMFCDMNGDFVYNVGENPKRDYSKIAKIHKGIEEYFHARVNYRCKVNNYVLSDIILGYISSGDVILADEIKEALISESGYDFLEPCTLLQ